MKSSAAGVPSLPGGRLPEISWMWLASELDTIETRPRDPYCIDPEHKRLFLEEIEPYWKGKSLEEVALARLPEDTKEIGVDTDILDTEMKWRSHVGEVTPDYQDIIFPKGFKAIRDEAKEALKKLEYTKAEDLPKIDFYKATIEAAEGIITLGQRYAQKAEEMAKTEQNPQRKKELLAIAENCRRLYGF